MPKMNFGFTWFYLVLILGIGFMLFGQRGANPQKIEWAEVEAMIEAGDVKEINFIRNDYQGKVTVRPERLAKYADKFGGQVPARSPHFIFMTSSKFDPEQVFGALNENLPAESQVKVIMENDSKIWSQLIEILLFPVLLILMWVFMFRGMGKNGGVGGPGAGGVFNVGKAQGKLADKNQVKVTFKDVAGLYGAKEEVMEIVDFLKNPSKYTALGAKIPKGALLVGPPGTGKTLLAKAVAGEADVPFFSISGSDFVEMFVGVGASRVRDLFRQAKEKAPCIVFIVIILAATNRADILDKALMRAGRFDRQIYVELPEVNEREEIFKVHLRGLKVSKDFDIKLMAKHTPGFSGADIANVCNEAALTAARKNKKEIDTQDFMDAVDRIIGGLERKENTIMSQAEKRTTAYHEAGHAVVGWLLPEADPVLKVSIIPRGKALGVTWNLPEERKNWSKSYMMDEMCSLMGGRAAEMIINGEPSTGALSDFERLTNMAYSMVQYYGMSEKIGPMSFYDSTGARGYELVKPYSEKTAELMDQEVRTIVDEVQTRTDKILRDNDKAFREVAELLLEKEVIMADDLERILGPKVKSADRMQIQAAQEEKTEEAAHE